MKLETLESMKLRRSVRAYKPEQVADAELDLVLEAGVYAASGRNMQATKLVVVQDAETDVFFALSFCSWLTSATASTVVNAPD